MIADAQVRASTAALAVIERHLGKTVLRSPVDGIVSVIVGEIGENVHAGQPVLVIAATGKQWLSFNAREDLLRGLTVGTVTQVWRAGARQIMRPAVSAARAIRASESVGLCSSCGLVFDIVRRIRISFSILQG